MKTSPFNLWRALHGHALVNKAGRVVENFRKREEDDDPFVAIEEYPYRAEVDGDLRTYTEDGRWRVDEPDEEEDLLMLESGWGEVSRVPFNLQRALAGDKLVTRDGREARDFRKRPGLATTYPYSAEVDNQPACTYTKDGKWTIGGDNELDLFMAEEVEDEPSVTVTERLEEEVFALKARVATVEEKYQGRIADLEKQVERYWQVITVLSGGDK